VHTTEVLEKPTDLVLKISLDLDEGSSANQKSFDRVTVEVFDANLLVPSALHDASETADGTTRDSKRRDFCIHKGFPVTNCTARA
jgi:hypothetical protein